MDHSANPAASGASTACELCDSDGGTVVHRSDKLRVVLVDDADYPGFCRIIWNGHVREMTDLHASDRDVLMDTVWTVESIVRQTMQPFKINLASLGNMTPHLHWHVIPRYTDDAHFPAPVWAAAQRVALDASLQPRIARLAHLRTALEQGFAPVPERKLP
ncbi:HIT family protein [Herbaspirillum sp. RTI4]|uniref:HIT family protein n=1 Tax=Herbaspirillum sp. RTI4 TaxID=3048640 RepID=UPI002AB5464A|nr:HIT family protein [Herbaspirillum sp. RTI4]MDY7577862.1 HIT family protein [Herbaspirillum sp. RTI4]MEA9982480.1 HIT family protein [Herbaspirillum sp. RTI4]